MIERVYGLVHAVAREFAPDPRETVFEVGVTREEGVIVLYGATSEPAAAEALHERVALLEGGVSVRDEVHRLPVEEEGFRAHAIVRAAAAPMLAGPLISETPVSQVVMGHRLHVLREHGRWLHCRSTDGYLGWVHRGYVTRATEVEARAWEVGTEAVPHFSLGAEVLGGAGEVVARVPWGARIGVEGEWAVLPDGRRGRLRGGVVPLPSLAERFPERGESIVAVALEWTGAPYLWGGITPAGADCSGLVQAVYRAHGHELPRDSDQQARMGEAVEVGERFEELKPGDLLFFAEESDRISHVAISRGGPGIVHSALGNGGVSTNDLSGELGIERELRSLFVAARRIIAPGPERSGRSGGGVGRGPG